MMLSLRAKRSNLARQRYSPERDCFVAALLAMTVGRRGSIFTATDEERSGRCPMVRVGGEPVMLALGEDYPELRAVGAQDLREISRRLLARAGRRSRPIRPNSSTELTAAGFLASLIPEEYGGSGLPLRAAAVILEEINASGCTASQGHAQMYIMGTLLRHGSAEQKQRYLPGIASRRIAAAGLRRHRADHRLRHDQAEDPRGAQRQRRPLRGQRPEGVDLARPALRPDAAAGAHHPGRGGQAPHRRAVGVSGRSAREPRATASRSGRSRR